MGNPTILFKKEAKSNEEWYELFDDIVNNKDKYLNKELIYEVKSKRNNKELPPCTLRDIILDITKNIIILGDGRGSIYREKSGNIKPYYRKITIKET